MLIIIVDAIFLAITILVPSLMIGAGIAMLIALAASLRGKPPQFTLYEIFSIVIGAPWLIILALGFLIPWMTALSFYYCLIGVVEVAIMTTWMTRASLKWQREYFERKDPNRGLRS